MAKEVTPGAKCKVIGSASGPTGTSVGRIVMAEFRYLWEHPMRGPIWKVKPIDGNGGFDIQGGGQSPEADMAADWLVPLDDDDPALLRLVEEKLITTMSDHG